MIPSFTKNNKIMKKSPTSPNPLPLPNEIWHMIQDILKKDIKYRGEALEVSVYQNDTKTGIICCPHPYEVAFRTQWIIKPGFMPKHWLYKDKEKEGYYVTFYPVPWEEVDFILTLIQLHGS